ncbi:hypothetical protein M9Y10_026074 [Tritrichomonas musculus]|uniref:Protein kinase domain-containing protein n=1 Tax=Tritrichomonas musculus TaxID=1915356 RepID=A0ABR2H8E1_9EUKA
MNFSLDDWLLNLENYEKQDLIEKNDELEIYQIINKETKEKFKAKIINTTINNFFQIEISNHFQDFFIMTKFYHESILKIVGFCPVDFDKNQKPVLVTEFANDTIFDLLQREKSKNDPNTNWNPTKKLINIYGIAYAMNLIHKKNIVHQNLTSKNIFLDNSLYPKISNFNQSKIIKTTERKNDKSKDIYDFSKIVYEIMTNEFFDKNSLFQSKEKIPKKYFELIEKCCSEDPKKRPSFEKIVKQLKNKSDFIVDGVDQQEFDRYVNLMKHSKFQNDVNQLNHLISSKIQNIAKKTYLDIKKYKIVEIIAKGIYSDIYKIQEKETGKFFSAKIYNEKSINNPEKLEQQFKEIKLLTKLNHPSIMKYIGYSPIDFDSNLALTVIIETGQILENIIQSNQNRETPTGWNSTKKLINIYGIASAMKYLHSLGIIHRNLRCGNIIEDENFYPKICSFSFFKYLYELNDEYNEKYFFNPAGSAPEVLESQIYSKESDVYSFAFIVYEIMTNDVPYSEFKNPFDFIRGVALENQRPKFNKLIPKCYQNLIESCWSTDPEQRPSFDLIVDKLKSDESFIVDGVDRDEYKKYIESINQVTDSLDYLDINDYGKIEKIGYSNFSNVFKVKEKSTYKLYAAKVLKKESGDLTEEENSLLSRELKIMKKLNHPSIIKIKGFSPITFNYNQHPTIIMELGNCSLQKMLDLEKNKLSPVHWNSTKKLINIYGIASGMQYLHSMNIIHRDLKPSNILEDSHLFPKISDFGLSKEIHKNAESITFQSILDQKGTTFYIAPEVWKECNYTKACDVYAFSMIVYEIIYGQQPFKDFNNNFITKVVNGERPKLNDTIPECYQKLIERCWSHDLNKRPTFNEIVQLLKTDDFMTDLIDTDEYKKYIEYVEKYNDVNIDTFVFDTIDIDLTRDEDIDLISFSSEIKKYDLKKLIRKEKLGSGSFAKVYKVINYSTGEIYAAKILKNELIFCSKNEQINFTREVNILSKLNHKSIMKFIGYSLIDFKQEEKPVLITELLTSGTLEDILEMERIGYPHLEWNETKKLINIYGIASAMKHLHSKSCIHRDLKPQNILLDKNLYPKLSDFGLSKLCSLDNNENTKIALGTPIYMAPEIWNSYDYTKAVDVYAFSLIVYEIITNVKPFNGMNIYMICYKISKNYRPEIKDDVPDCYKTLIEKCWDQDQSKRPSFDEITEFIKNDPDFKNEKVDIDEFNRYVEFVEKEFGFNEHLMNKPDTNLANKNEFVINLLNQEIEKEVKKSPDNKIIIDLNDYEQREILKKDLFNKFFKVIRKDTGQLYTARSADVELNQFKKEEITQFIKDLNKLLLLNHPAIIKLIGFSPFNFKKEFKPVFINELSPKLTLNDIFKNEKKKLIIPGWNSTKKLINIYGIASAMKYLHSLDIVHQNLKPDNIFVDEYFYPKLSEIGFFTHKLIIHSMTLQSASKVPQSAVIYSAPEVLKNGIYTKESDVFSFCLIIYELMTNENLNVSSSALFSDDLLDKRKIEFKTPIPICYRNLIERGLSKNPNERPSFDQIVNNLETDSGFITPDVSKNEYFHYIEKVSEKIPAF